MKIKISSPIRLKLALEFCAHVRAEFERASAKHGSAFASAHEGWAVLYEEVDELWDEVRKKRSNRDKKAMYGECVQIAAMALKFAISICCKETT